MAEFNVDVSKLPEDVREKLAELDLELSEDFRGHHFRFNQYVTQRILLKLYIRRSLSPSKVKVNLQKPSPHSANLCHPANSVNRRSTDRRLRLRFCSRVPRQSACRATNDRRSLESLVASD
ncbi:hypothetical protein LSTR_LSTR015587 [Laodelphax striatellus]|uniref:DMAP1-binding domain-containing protein n=1 Tax=Laodelphax striatellus TaxID=195883 RepID=A0A482XE21_LAOST|nr:hypothetical protein LSTR_LSTR015587 [Laodelphax striatellus]